MEVLIYHIMRHVLQYQSWTWSYLSPSLFLLMRTMFPLQFRHHSMPFHSNKTLNKWILTRYNHICVEVPWNKIIKSNKQTLTNVYMFRWTWNIDISMLTKSYSLMQFLYKNKWKAISWRVDALSALFWREDTLSALLFLSVTGSKTVSECPII